MMLASFLAHCCSFSLLFPPFRVSRTHPEYQAVGDEKSLQTGDHRLRLEPTRRWRHAGEMAVNFNPKIKSRYGWEGEGDSLHFALQSRGEKKKNLWVKFQKGGGNGVSVPPHRKNGKRGEKNRPVFDHLRCVRVWNVAFFDHINWKKRTEHKRKLQSSTTSK